MLHATTITCLRFEKSNNIWGGRNSTEPHVMPFYGFSIPAFLPAVNRSIFITPLNSNKNNNKYYYYYYWGMG